MLFLSVLLFYICKVQLLEYMCIILVNSYVSLMRKMDFIILILCNASGYINLFNPQVFVFEKSNLQMNR